MGFSLQTIYAHESQPDPWAQDAITIVAESQLVNMDRVNDYGAPITRQAYGYMIYQLYEHLTSAPIATQMPLKSEKGFTDLRSVSESESDGYGLTFDGPDTLYLEALKAIGLIEGYPDGTYRPTDYITREEIMTLYVRLLEQLGYELEISEIIFDDETSISDWSFESVKKCYATGLVQGIGNNQVNPKGYATVQETLVVMSRILTHNQIEPVVMHASRSARSIVSNGYHTYSVSYDVFGRTTGIAHYEDYMYLEEIYEGNLGDEHLYMVGDRLYFFDAHRQLMFYDGAVSPTNFMASDTMDGWYMAHQTLYYNIEGLWLAYNLEKGFATNGEGSFNETMVLQGNNLIYQEVIIELGVVSFDQIGNKVYWLSEDEHLYGRDIVNGDFIDYGVVTANGLEVSWNYLILTDSAINGVKVVRYIPIFAIESYLF